MAFTTLLTRKSRSRSPGIRHFIPRDQLVIVAGAVFFWFGNQSSQRPAEKDPTQRCPACAMKIPLRRRVVLMHERVSQASALVLCRSLIGRKKHTSKTTDHVPPPRKFCIMLAVAAGLLLKARLQMPNALTYACRSCSLLIAGWPRNRNDSTRRRINCALLAYTTRGSDPQRLVIIWPVARDQCRV